MALDKQALIDGLNSDLAGEYAAIIQYTHYAATVTGPFRESLRTMFMAEVPDEQRHSQYLADQIAFLGGTPTTAPRQVPEAGTPKEMLRVSWRPRRGRSRTTTNASGRPRRSATPASRWCWRTRSLTRPITSRRCRGCSPAGRIDSHSRTPAYRVGSSTSDPSPGSVPTEPDSVSPSGRNLPGELCSFFIMESRGSEDRRRRLGSRG